MNKNEPEWTKMDSAFFIPQREEGKYLERRNTIPLLREQEVAGSNPVAPTDESYYEKKTYGNRPTHLKSGDFLFGSQLEAFDVHSLVVGESRSERRR